MVQLEPLVYRLILCVGLAAMSCSGRTDDVESADADAGDELAATPLDSVGSSGPSLDDETTAHDSLASPAQDARPSAVETGASRDPRAWRSGEIGRHRELKVRVRGGDLDLRRTLVDVGLRVDDLDGEMVAVYLDAPLPAVVLDALRRNDGIETIADLWIPPLPAHPHGYHLMRVPYAALDRLAADPRVRALASVEFALSPTNAEARLATSVEDVHAGLNSLQLTGAGVHVCIIDDSFWLQHPDFPTPLFAYDVTDGATPASWSNQVRLDISGHGTHVAGTAIGRGTSSAGHYRGAAPGASFSVFKAARDSDGLFLEVDIIKALNHVDNIGCDVVSMSLGGMADYPDGSDTLAQAVDSVSALGIPVLIAAGNSQSDQIHDSVSLSPSSATTIQFSITASWTQLRTEHWFNLNWRGNNNDVTLACTNLAAGETLTRELSGTSSRNTRLVQYVLTPRVAANTTKTYQFRLTSGAGAGSVLFHIFQVSGVGQFDSPDPQFTLNTPSLADSAITVGAYTQSGAWINYQGSSRFATSLTEGEVASFSSLGPRIDGDRRPHIVAPGAVTISCRDSVALTDAGSIIDDDGLMLNGSGPANYYVMAGTSMATPFVAGSAALILQVNPGLTPSALRSVLMQTADHAANPDNIWGSGLINIREAVRVAQCMPGGIVSGGNCNDGDPCTTLDKCQNNACVGSDTAAVDCDDNNPCTRETCDPQSGCKHTQIVGACNDGNACTTNDVCTDGVCAGVDTAAADCNDGNACTNDSCDSATGCLHANHVGACEDQNVCTVGNVCAGGVCGVDTSADCNDNNVCTDDTCDAVLGCKYTDNASACDDDNACTTGDVCAGAACGGVDTSALDCDDDNVCTDDTCDSARGCLHANNTSACSDENACTKGDVCGGGSCGGVDTSASDCNDNNGCTDDTCDAATGCRNGANNSACDDDDACTTGDVCAGGACAGANTSAVDCDDKDVCTDDTCDVVLGCQHADNVSACNDQNACTTGDVCVAGVCGGVDTSVADCNDNNGCTDDSCDVARGCLHANNANACDDQNVCTIGNVCVAGACGVDTSASVCNDNDVCTDDSCDAVLGCLHVGHSRACNDRNACTTGDVCTAGVCRGNDTSWFDCDDHNACTNDTCDLTFGCQHVANAYACDDGNVCTTGDRCAGGNCLGTPRPAADCDDQNPCTDDVCDSASGCQHYNNTSACTDNNACTLVYRCGGGRCVGSSPRTCDDGNVCTDDSCEPGLGCTARPRSGACDDGNMSTHSDACAASSCRGSAIICAPPGPCQLIGTAKGVRDCPAVPDPSTTRVCSDGLATTSDDHCDGRGACVGAPILCAFGTCEHAGVPDGEVCTPRKDPMGTPCNDNLSTTADDVCDGNGVCAGAPIVCPADDACRTATANGVGCTFAYASAGTLCTDADMGTRDDRCDAQGACVGTAYDCAPIGLCELPGTHDGQGCVRQWMERGTSCDDGAIETAGDHCDADGQCVGTPIVCDADTECAQYVPDGVGCTMTARSGACDDGLANTRDDQCDGGDCVGAPYECAQGACVGGSIPDGIGCVDYPADDGTKCEDADPCTRNDVCADGLCRGGEPSCAPDETCDARGECVRDGGDIGPEAAELTPEAVEEELIEPEVEAEPVEPDGGDAVDARPAPRGGRDAGCGGGEPASWLWALAFMLAGAIRCQTRVRLTRR